MALLKDGAPLATYPVSTSKFGLGDRPGTSWTPLGKLEIAKKIGAAPRAAQRSRIDGQRARSCRPTRRVATSS